MVAQLVALLEPWKNLYSDSTAVSTTVTGAHILSLLLAGGLAIAADRSTLRALRLAPDERGSLLAELHAVHRPVLIALSVLVVTGVLLAAADLETFIASPLFWVKLGLVALLLLNGIALYRVGSQLLTASSTDTGERTWRALRVATWRSLALWIATTVAGTILTSAA